MTIHHNTAVQDNGINPDWPRVQYCLGFKNRTLYCEFLDDIPRKRDHELEPALFHTVRAGLIEGKSHEDLRAEIAPLVSGYRLSESQACVGNMIAKVTKWLKNDPCTPKSRHKRKWDSLGAQRTYQKPPVANLSSRPSTGESPRLQLIRKIARQQENTL